jgi:hypothetical protein
MVGLIGRASLLLLCLQGAYLIRIHEHVQQRPAFLVERVIGSVRACVPSPAEDDDQAGPDEPAPLRIFT